MVGKKICFGDGTASTSWAGMTSEEEFNALVDAEMKRILKKEYTREGEQARLRTGAFAS